MKLLHVLAGLDPKEGGVSQAIRTMIKGLSSEGVINEVACIDGAEATFLQDLPFKVYGLGPGKTSWKYSRPLLNWLNDNIIHYDAVIIHGLWQFHTYATYRSWMKQGKKRGVRLFVMPHGMLDPYFQRATGRRLKALRNFLFWKLIEKKAVNNANALLFTCETEKLLAREPFKPYTPNAEKVVGLGVEVDIPEVVNKANESNKYILFISRIHPKKGVDLLVDAYQELLKEKGDCIPDLIIAGPGIDSEFGAGVKQKIANNSKIFLPGMLEGRAKWEAFLNCDAFVLPSHQENFGVAVVEALACYKPVLISNQVNIWQEIADGGGGIIGADDFEGVKRMLTTWIDMSLSDKNAMKLNAHNVFIKHFSVEKAAKKMILALNG